MNIRNNYQYIKPLLGVALISVILFCGGCNKQWLYEHGFIAEPPENVESLSSNESCSKKPKTRGWGVHERQNEEQNCQQP